MYPPAMSVGLDPPLQGENSMALSAMDTWMWANIFIWEMLFQEKNHIMMTDLDLVANSFEQLVLA